MTNAPAKQSTIIEAVSASIKLLERSKESAGIDPVTGKIKFSTRGLSDVLLVSNKSLWNLLTKLQLEGVTQNSDPALVMLASTVLEGVTQNVDLDEVQVGLLINYYARNSRVSDEVRHHNQVLLAALTAVGIRTLIYRAHGLNQDYTPTASPNRVIQDSEMVQVKGRTIATNPLIEQALQEMAIPYYTNIRIRGVSSISHEGHQKLDFYCPTVGKYGLAIKGYYQNGGGSGYQKICTYKDEIQYRYPCPGMMVLSGEWLCNDKHARRMTDFARSFVNWNGKLREVIQSPMEELVPMVKQALSRHVGEDYRGDRFEDLTRSGLRLTPAG